MESPILPITRTAHTNLASKTLSWNPRWPGLELWVAAVVITFVVPGAFTKKSLWCHQII